MKGGLNQGDGEPSEADLALELLPLFPHAVQATLVGNNFRVWTSLTEANIVGLASDLILKHGVVIPGQWHMLGVLDALTDAGGAPTPSNDTAAIMAGTPIGGLAAMMATGIRQFFGRPATSFGMTPLLIFRAVSG